MEADVDTFKMKLGDSAPDFKLPATDGKTYSLASFNEKKILIVAFTCNHCPYVLAWEGRLKAVYDAFADSGVQLVTINSNSTVTHPTDGFEHMKERAKEMNFTYPYLRDESQEIAKAYSAQVTPEVFVFDEERKLRYHGRVDSDHENPKDAVPELRNAVEALLAGKEPNPAETPILGCSVKWAL